MKDDGRAVLILGGINKLVKGKEGRSDAYNGKAKREFFHVLYNRYNVTDHFTVAGELYEKQGAGYPIDVIAINGRGKSARAPFRGRAPGATLVGRAQGKAHQCRSTRPNSTSRRRSQRA
jgi:hypothetical protein